MQENLKESLIHLKKLHKEMSDSELRSVCDALSDLERDARETRQKIEKAMNNDEIVVYNPREFSFTDNFRQRVDSALSRHVWELGRVFTLRDVIDAIQRGETKCGV